MELVTDKRGAPFVPADLFHRVHVLPAGYWQGGWRAKIRAGGRLLGAAFAAFKILRHFKPHVVWGFGGGASVVPLGVAALLKKPCGIYQADSVLGRANRLLGSISTVIVTGFPHTQGLPQKKQATWVGIPVRDTLSPVAYPQRSGTDRFHLIVLGGSQGAKIWSTLLPQAVCLLAPDIQQKLQILQQCRKDLMPGTQQAYGSCHAHVTLVPFIDSIGEALQKAHLVLTRAGASTIGELACVGRPALFVPYPHAAQNHQVENARAVVEAGGGWCFLENQLTPPLLASFLENAILRPQSLQEAAQKIQFLYDTQGIHRFVQIVENFFCLTPDDPSRCEGRKSASTACTHSGSS